MTKTTPFRRELVGLSICLSILGGFFNYLSIPQIALAVTEPALPQSYIDTTYPTLPLGHIIRNVKTSCGPSEQNCYTSVQAAVNAANYGEEVVLQAGATFTEAVTLPYKTGTGWIVIRTSNLNGLPPAGTRVQPSHASAMAKLVTPGGNAPALRTASTDGQNGVHNYRIVGLEITKIDNGWHCNDYQTTGYQSAGCLGDMILIGYGGLQQNTIAEMPQDIILDRVYVHTTPTDNYKRGIALNAGRTAIIDSYISQHDKIVEGQAIAGWNGTGPYKIVNNYLEGSGENVLFGGSDALIPNATASDIEFRNNYLFKPKSWFINDPTYSGYRAFVKNNFELKCAKRVLVDGNIFDGSWAHGQDGFLILITPRNQDGKSPWCGVQDVTFSNNIVRNGAAGVNMSATDDNHSSTVTERIKFYNNVFTGIDGPKWGGGRGWLAMFGGNPIGTGPNHIQFIHNTVFQNSTILYFMNYRNGAWDIKTNFVFKDNIVPYNGYGVFGATVQDFGDDTLNKYAPGAVFTKNILMGGPASKYTQHPGNYFPTSWNGVLVNQAAGDYTVVSGSTYDNAGTDGKDIGADIGTINAISSNVVSGIFSSTPPPPPPPPTPPTPPPPPSPPADTSAPVISVFAINPSTITVGSSISPSFTVTDTGGSYLRVAELWRATDNGSTCTLTVISNCAWTLRQTINAPSASNSWQSNFSEAPAQGVYIYGIHVGDYANNVGFEPSLVRVTVNAAQASDTTPPVVTISAPSADASVTGNSVSITANASDNVGVAGVQFKLDGSNLGDEDTSAPYSVSWNSTQASNGVHTLTAVARDTVGNQTTSSGVAVNVNNSAVTPPPPPPPGPTPPPPSPSPSPSPSPGPSPSPSPPPAPSGFNVTASKYPSGMFIKYANDATVYLINSGIKQPITDWTVYQNRVASSRHIITIPDYVTFSTGSILGLRSGTLVKASNNPTVYLTDGNNRLAFTSQSQFISLGYSFGQVYTINDLNLINALPIVNINTSEFMRPHGSLIKYADSQTVYFLDNGVRRPYTSMFMFKAWNDRLDQVVTVPTTEQYPDGPHITLPNGIVAKTPESTNYYLTAENMLRPIYYSFMLSLGIKENQYITVSSEDLSRQVTGANWD